MSRPDGEPLVGIVVVSHSAKAAEGAVDIARQQAPEVTIVPAGGDVDGGLGEDPNAIAEAIQRADSGAGVVVVMDLNGAVTAAKVALTMVDPDLAGRTRLSDGPLVEGAFVAAIQASIGDPLDEVLQAARDAAHLEKAVD